MYSRLKRYKEIWCGCRTLYQGFNSIQAAHLSPGGFYEIDIYPAVKTKSETFHCVHLRLSTSCSRFLEKFPEISRKVVQKLLEKSKKMLFVAKVAENSVAQKDENICYLITYTVALR